MKVYIIDPDATAAQNRAAARLMAVMTGDTVRMAARCRYCAQPVARGRTDYCHHHGKAANRAYARALIAAEGMGAPAYGDWKDAQQCAAERIR
jgi:hypothetical protein